MTRCPVCETETDASVGDSPYWKCGDCGLWFQHPIPPKIYHGPDRMIEYDIEEMPERDKAINRELARSLFDSQMKGIPGITLDVGSKNPVLARAFLDMGCQAYALDHERPRDDLGVEFLQFDFEHWTPPTTVCGFFDLITIIHTFEHFEDPARALTLLARLLHPNGRVFIRCPDASVAGIERDLTPHHYAIHPYVWAPSSLTELLCRLELFTIESLYQMHGSGQTDFVLRPL